MNGASILCADGTDTLSEEQISNISRLLSEKRRRKAESYLRRTDRNNCIVAGFLLLIVLYERYGVRYIPPVCEGIRGKPYFSDADFGYFNISHSGCSVCCAAAETCIGVDIQTKVSSPESLFSIAMSQNEIAEICASSDPMMLSAVYWSRKEAYTKYLSSGIDEKIKQYDFSAFKEPCFSYRGLHFFTELNGDTALACCSAEKEYTLKWMHITELTERYQTLLSGN
ncbi:MAG: 4'-phosphopantetheinyl transferase superfamily protein [Oscillospiraceae bacterium]|nr:4'-phosphopantetheinyl transferase superfamily protein [Oscillospiraceae bacterium]